MAWQVYAKHRGNWIAVGLPGSRSDKQAEVLDHRTRIKAGTELKLSDIHAVPINPS